MKMLDAADAHPPSLAALVPLLTYNGVRIDGALAADVTDYSYWRGHRMIRILRKGGKTATVPTDHHHSVDRAEILDFDRGQLRKQHPAATAFSSHASRAP